MARAQLNVSATLKLPLETVTQTTAILAIKGSGKTNTAVVMAEELSRANEQVVVLDPTGVWYGIRSSADGQSAGLPFVIFGGEHADVPLEPGAGEMIATAIAEGGFSAVLDLSGLRKSQFIQFTAAFLENIYRVKAKNKSAMLLVVDEADTVAPQKPFGQEALALGAMQDVVRRGRSRGIGVVMISQRPQVLNKDVLTQADLLVALRMSHPNEMKAVQEWVNVHADPATAKQMFESLPSLPTGAAWFWSPSSELFAKAQVRKRDTFDSSYTPKPGQRRKEPKKLAQVDLEKLGAQIAATVQKQKENDPAALKRRITELEREAAKKAPPTPAAPAPPRVITQREKDAIARPFVRERQYFVKELKTLRSQGFQVLKAVEQLYNVLDIGIDAMENSLPPEPTMGGGELIARTAEAAKQEAQRMAARPRPDLVPAAAPAPPIDGEVKLRGKSIDMLRVLARMYPKGLTEAQVATQAQIKRTGGTFGDYKSLLKTSGCLRIEGGLWYATEEGMRRAGNDIPAAPASTDEVLALWLPRLRGKSKDMLQALLAAPGYTMTRQELGDAAGVSTSGGTFGDYLSLLKTADLITVNGSSISANPETLML